MPPAIRPCRGRFIGANITAVPPLALSLPLGEGTLSHAPCVVFEAVQLTQRPFSQGEKDRMRGESLVHCSMTYVSAYARRRGPMQELVPTSEMDSRLRGNDASGWQLSVMLAPNAPSRGRRRGQFPSSVRASTAEFRLNVVQETPKAIWDRHERRRRLYRRLMVNDGMVNARSTCENRAYFCEIFAVLGRFPRFKNPVKYSRRIDINHDTVRFAPAARPAPQLLSCDISALCRS